MRWDKEEVLRLIDNYDELRARAARIVQFYTFSNCESKDILYLDCIDEPNKPRMLSIEFVQFPTLNKADMDVVPNVTYRKQVVPFEWLFLSGDALKQAQERYEGEW